MQTSTNVNGLSIKQRYGAHPMTAEQIVTQLHWQSHPQEVFDKAITDGRLSADPTSPRYAGHYMYMYHDHAGAAHFKHTTTRRYLPADELLT